MDSKLMLTIILIYILMVEQLIECQTSPCSNGQYDLNGTCYSICPLRYYANKTSFTCLACHTSCKNCTDSLATSCNECEGTLMLYQAPLGSCMGTCPSLKFYPNLASNLCSQCYKTCLKCVGANSNNCTVCELPRVFTQSTGECDCQIGMAEDPNTQICMCATGLFYNSNSTKCEQKCTLSLVGDPISQTCIDTCREGYYTDKSTMICNKCDQKCQYCAGPNNGQCHTCAYSYFFIKTNGTCSSNCPDGTFKNNALQQCTSCHANCLTCIGELDLNCTTCSASKLLFFDKTTNQCVQQCPVGTLADPTNQTCMIKCQQTLYTLFEHQLTRTCFKICPEGTFGNNNTLICQSCNETCLACSNATQNDCLSCAEPRIVQDIGNGQKQCICRDHYFSIFDIQAQKEICQICDPSCARCSGPGQRDCLSCSVNLLFNPPTNQCLATCPTGTSADFNTQQCTSICPTDYQPLQQQQQSVCVYSKCQQPLYANSLLQCVTQCPDGTFADQMSRLCLPCVKPCATCTGPLPSSCLKCNNTKMVMLSTTPGPCSCPLGMVYDTIITSDCVVDPATQLCTASSFPFFDLLSQTCVQLCPIDGRYLEASQKLCLPCHVSCLRCIGPTEHNCSSCKPPFLFDHSSCTLQCPVYTDPIAYECVSACGSGQLLEPVNKICLSSCPSGTVVVNSSICENTGLVQCQQKFSQQQLYFNLLWQKCEDTAQQCLGRGMLIDNSTQTCVDHCPIELIQDTINFACVSQCQTSHFLFESESHQRFCLGACSQFPGLFASIVNSTIKVCSKCDVSCVDCFGQANNCTSCATPGFLSAGLCVATCLSPLYHDISTRQCLQSCQTGMFALDSGVSTILKQSICVWTCPSDTEASALTMKCIAFLTSTNITKHVNCSTQTTNIYFAVENATCTDNCNNLGLYTNQMNLACVAQCDVGFFADNGSVPIGVCTACHFTCKTCSGAMSTQCLSCNTLKSEYSFFVAEKGICSSTCESGQYPDFQSQSCKLCPSSCKSCASKAVCLSCAATYIFDVEQQTCLTTCPSNKYQVSQGSGANIILYCARCHPDCATCSEPLKCLSCRQGLFVYEYLNYTIDPPIKILRCVSDCSAIQGQFAVYNDNQCQNCSQYCSSCAFSPKLCTSCMTGFILNQVNYTCDPPSVAGTCQSGEYFNTSICQSCQEYDQYCLSCTLNTSNTISCSSCSDGAFYNYQLLSCQLCSSQIPSAATNQKLCPNCQMAALSPFEFKCICEYDSFYDTTSKSCRRCSTVVLGCLGNCSAVGSPLNYICGNCGQGFYYDTWSSTTEKVCKSCSAVLPGCLACSVVSGSQILSCALCGGEISMYYSYGLGRCEPCVNRFKGCRECGRSLVGMSGSIDSSDVAVMCFDCGESNTFDPVEGRCLACEMRLQECGTCIFKAASSSSNTTAYTFECQQCKEGFFLDITVRICRTCADQLPGCLACTYITLDNSMACQKCLSGFLLNSQQKTCISSSQVSGSICDNNCVNCGQQTIQLEGVGAVFICLECKPDYFPHRTTMKCVQDQHCLEGQLFNGTSCKNCSEILGNCTRCHNKPLTGEPICDVCQHSYKLVGGMCVFTPGQRNCPAGCTDCLYHLGSTECKGACLYGYFFDQGQCVFDCSSIGLTNCLKCQRLTSIGSSLIANGELYKCQQCRDGYALSLQSICLKKVECPERFALVLENYFTVGQCYPCPQNCFGCVYEAAHSKTKCLLCLRNFSPDKSGECVLIPGSDQVSEAVKDGQLQPQCPSGCQTCKFDATQLGLIKCTSCSYGFALQVQGEFLITCTLNCEQTLPNCEVCTQLTLCHACKRGFVLTVEGQCIRDQLCPYIFNPILQKCVNCPLGCQKCIWSDLIMQSTCVFPIIGSYVLSANGLCSPKLYNKQESCPQFTYADMFAQECRSCPIHCTKCDNANELKQLLCRICNIGYVFNNNGCTSQIIDSSCVIGHYREGEMERCLECPAGCANCDNLKTATVNQLYCYSCIDQINWFYSALSGRCYNKACPVGSAFNLLIGSCIPCPFMCEKCFFTQDNQLQPQLTCYTCNVGYRLNPDNSNSCLVSNCPIGTVKVQETNQCVSCPIFCYQCNQQTKCSTCGVNYTLTSEGFCVKNICSGQQQYYGYQMLNYNSGAEDWVLGCYPCPQGCAQCFFNYTINLPICTACISSDQYELRNITIIDNRLQAINAVIASTTTITICFFKATLTCATDEAVAIMYQELGLAENSNLAMYCKKCSIGCSKCAWNNREFCLQCSHGFSMTISSANDGGNGNGEQICQPDSATLAILASCLTGQYYNYQQAKCLPCPEGCGTCQQQINAPSMLKSTVVCLTCKEGSSNHYYLKYNQCILQCNTKEGYFALKTITPDQQAGGQASQQICVKCSISSCQSCELNYNQAPPKQMCLQCIQGHQLSQAADGTMICLPMSQTPCNAKEYVAFGVVCKPCPPGCEACQATFPEELLTPIICSKCVENYTVNALGTCILQQINPTVSCISGFYPLVSSSNSTYNCMNCPTGCSRCDRKKLSQNITIVVCLECQSGYYTFYKTDTKQMYCQLLVSDLMCQSQTLYALMLDRSNASDYICRPCPDTCLACTLADFFDPSTLQCSYCIDGLVLATTTKKCSKPFAGGIIDSTACSTGLYSALIDGFVTCMSCPYGCTLCRMDDPKSFTSDLLCQGCALGFSLNATAQKCTFICQVGQYATYLSTGKVSCLSCYWTCATCRGSGPQQCSSCISGLKLNAKGECLNPIITESQMSAMRCGPQAFFHQIAQKCVCNKIGQIFFEEQQRCVMDPKEISGNCTIGYFFEQNNCIACKVNGERQSCAVCKGPQPIECIACIAGDFLDPVLLTCSPCSFGCQLCFKSKQCERCWPGFFISQQQGEQLCHVECPLGTLPTVESLYELNQELFSREEIEASLQIKVQTIQPNDIAGTYAIALGIMGQPVYTNLPWRIDQMSKVPIYNQAKVRLECRPCREGCAACAVGWLYVKSKKLCVDSQFCPTNFTKKYEKGKVICVEKLPNDFYIENVVIVSLEPASKVQPHDKPLILVATTSRDSNYMLKYKWRILDIIRDKSLSKEVGSVGQEGIEWKLEIKQKLLSGVDTTQSRLIISEQSLQKNINVIFEIQVYCTTIDAVVTAQEQVMIPIRDITGEQPLQSLSINPYLFSITPETGVSGQTVFQAQHILSQIPAFQQPGWSVTIEVGNGLTTFSSSRLNNQFEFSVPVNFSTDNFIQVVLKVSRVIGGGGESSGIQGSTYYTTRHIIIAKANPNFTLTDSPAIKNLLNNDQNYQQTLQTKDLAAGALIVNSMAQQDQAQSQCQAANQLLQNKDMLLTRGPCSPDEESPCCGHGACVNSNLNTKYVCECSTNYTGVMCNVKQNTLTQAKNAIDKIIVQLENTEINSGNVNQAIDTIKQIAQSQLIDKMAIDKILIKLNSTVNSPYKVMNDSQTIKQILEAASNIKTGTISQIYGNDSIKANEQQLQILKLVTQAVANGAAALNQTTMLSQTIQTADMIASLKMLEKTLGTGSGSSNQTSLFKGFAVSLPSKVLQNDSISYKVAVGADTLGNLSLINGSNSNDSSSFYAISCIVMNRGQLGGAALSGNIVSENLEISIVNSLGKILPVNQLQGACPISFTLVLNLKNITKSDGLQCMYFDIQRQTYQKDGCIKMVAQRLYDNVFEIQCCCNHLTLFGISYNLNQAIDVTKPNSTNNTVDQNNTNQNNSINTNTLPTATVAKFTSKILFYFLLLSFLTLLIIIK